MFSFDAKKPVDPIDIVDPKVRLISVLDATLVQMPPPYPHMIVAADLAEYLDSIKEVFTDGEYIDCMGALKTYYDSVTAAYD